MDLSRPSDSVGVLDFAVQNCEGFSVGKKEMAVSKFKAFKEVWLVEVLSAVLIRSFGWGGGNV